MKVISFKLSNLKYSYLKEAICEYLMKKNKKNKKNIVLLHTKKEPPVCTRRLGREQIPDRSKGKIVSILNT
jgi:hypothetical protein